MFDKEFYGSTTIGERGQVVIPIEARKALGIEKGEKLLVFSVHKKSIMITKLTSFKQMSAEMKKRQAEVEDILSKS